MQQLFTNRDLLKLIIPLVIERALSNSVGFFDTIMVTSCGEAAVSGVSLVDSINTILIQILVALAAGGSVVCSQYIGNGNQEKARLTAAQLVMLIGIVSCVLAAISLLTGKEVLTAVFGHVSEDVMGNAETYFAVSAMTYPFIGLYSAGSFLFRCMGNGKISLYVSLLMNVMNVAGNAVLIYGFGFGVFGAALSTLISRFFAAIVIIALLCKRDNPLCILAAGSAKLSADIVGRILKIGVPRGAENLLFDVGHVSVMSLLATFGTTAVAAHSVFVSVARFINIPGEAVGFAMVAVIGQCIGAGEKDQARSNCKKLIAFAYAGTAFVGVILFVVAGNLSVFYTLSPEAERLAAAFIVVDAVMSMLIRPLGFVLPDSLRAAGDAKFTMKVCLVSMFVFRVAICYALSPVFGVWGIVAGKYVDWAFRALAFTMRSRGSKWLEMKVV